MTEQSCQKIVVKEYYEVFLRDERIFHYFFTILSSNACCCVRKCDNNHSANVHPTLSLPNKESRPEGLHQSSSFAETATTENA